MGTEYFSRDKKKDEGSASWKVHKAASTLTLGAVAPPRTERAEDYRPRFLAKNPGIFSYPVYRGGRWRKAGLYFCIYCGKPITRRGMQVDHIRPLDKGGVNATWNLGPACPHCNGAECKGSKGGIWIVRGRIGNALWKPIQAISKFFHPQRKQTDVLSIIGEVLGYAFDGAVLSAAFTVSVCTRVSSIALRLTTGVFTGKKDIVSQLSKVAWVVGPVAGAYLYFF